MNKIKINQNKIITKLKFLGAFTILVVSLFIILSQSIVLIKTLSAVKNTDLYSRDNSSKFVYLTDLKYDTTKTSSPYLRIDQTAANNLIAVSINGKDTKFLKGLFLHAAGTAVYDIRSQNYDYFTAYMGVDIGNRAAHEGDGVRFKIYTSTDGNTWTEVLNDDKVYTSSMDAVKIKIDIRNANYLKLVTEPGRNNWSDHAVFAHAKLIKGDYVETTTTADFVRPVSEYDTQLKKVGINNILKDKELVLLQRKLVSAVGYDVLQAYAQYSNNDREALQWLMTNINALRYYITGGLPMGSYVNSLKVFARLYTAHKTDLTNTTITANGVKLSDLYLRMMVSLSLTHSANVCAWYGGNQCSDAVTRYEIYKKLQKEDKLENRIFETLTVEEMRWVMNNQIADEEIEWLNDWARQFPVTSGSRKGPYNREPYRYIAYTFGYNYSRDQYYSQENYEKWNKKYFLQKYNLTYEKGKPKIWIVFEEGGVCGATSKLGSNLNAVFGYPTAVIGQPGHAAYLEYWQADNGDGYWGIQNNISGWTASEKGERLLNAWGSYRWDSYYQVSYVPYGQYAQNHVQEYNKALEILLLIDSYPNDITKQEEIYRKALEYESINMDAWYGLIQLYNHKDNVTSKEYYELAEELANSLKNFPLPMLDLLNQFKAKITSPIYQVKYTLLEKSILEEGTRATDDSVGQVGLSGVTKTMANFFLGKNDYSVASFSFDGENAGKIILSDKFSGTQVHYEYSLDGKRTWKKTLDPKHQLTKEELAQINAENDIAIHIVGAAANDIYVIDIRTQDRPANIYNNDLENKVIGATNTMEWRMNSNDKWTLFKDKLPDLTGNKTVYVRNGSHGIFLAGEEVEMRFSEDIMNEKRKYVTISHLSIHGVSSQATAQGRHATNAIDGNYYTNWHSAWNGTDTQRFISIKFDQPLDLTAVEYVPGGGGNGKIIDGTLYGSMDGTNWKELKKVTGWAINDTTKSFELDAPAKVQYVKIVADRASNGNWMTARMFNFFEDVSKLDPLTAEIQYSTKNPTNKDVTVKLVNPNREITITNNDGKDTYVFTTNGEFTFQFEDAKGIKGQATAKVTWINKSAPNVTLKYSTTTATDKPVTVTLSSNKEIKITNNGGKNTYTFTENGTFEFTYVDSLGNKGKITAQVNWIKNKPGYNKPFTSNTVSSYYKKTKVTISKTSITEKIYLKKEDFLLDTTLKDRFGSNSEYFELYLVDEDNVKINITNGTIKIVFTLDPEKNFMAIYQLDEKNNPKQLHYKKVGENQIEIEPKTLDKYILEYKKKSISVKDPFEDKTGRMDDIIWHTAEVIMYGTMAIYGSVIYRRMKKKLKSTRR